MSLSELGARMKQRFEEVQRRGFTAAVPKGLAKTLSDAEKPKAMASAQAHH